MKYKAAFRLNLSLIRFRSISFRKLYLVSGILWVAVQPLTIAQSNIYQTLQSPFYDPYSDGCAASVDISLSGNDNIEKSFNFFVQKGLSAAQSSGLVGNFIWESHVNPKAMNELGYFGIAQWDPNPNGRLAGLKKFAQEQGMDYETLEPQLEYAWYELNNTQKAAGDDLKKQTTPESAANSVFVYYERAGDHTGPKRATFAKSVYKKYANNIDSGQEVTSPVSSDSCSPTEPGQDTKYIDGFTIYSQYDPAWVNKPYSSSTIGVSGCGPAVMAMIITALTGRQVTPVETSKYAGENGLYVPGAGSSWNLPPVLAPRWGLKATLIGKDIAKITATLQTGGLVIASGQGPKPFTSGGHYIVIRGVTSDNKWKVGDSGHNDTSDKDWEPQQLIGSMNDGSVYAITK